MTKRSIPNSRDIAFWSCHWTCASLSKAPPPKSGKLQPNYGPRSDLLTRLEIKGREGDDAVLCTESKTYALRSVNISNSLHVATGSEEVTYAGIGDELFLGEAIHEIMELVPTVPKLDRLKGALRGSEYGEEEWDTKVREDSMEQVQFDPQYYGSQLMWSTLGVAAILPRRDGSNHTSQ